MKSKKKNIYFLKKNQRKKTNKKILLQ
jgi:hypothetical protein